MEAVQSFQELGTRIREARLARRLEQSALAAATGLERTQISKIESGARGVSALELSRIAGALSLSLTDLVLVPPPDVRAARRPLDEIASVAEANLFDAQRALDRMWADAVQLRELGLLSTVALPVRTLASAEDGRTLARQVRRTLGDREGPLGSMADVAASLGLWTYVVDLEIEGLSMTPEPGLGVAVVGAPGEPGRRRTTVAHEIGHHVAGDVYNADAPLAASTSEREGWIDAFAAELLLPATVARKRLRRAERDELIRLAVEFRVSWSLVVRVAREGGIDVSGMDTTMPPTDQDLFVAAGRKPDPDLLVGATASAWVTACAIAARRGDITSSRAVEMARGALDS